MTIDTVIDAVQGVKRFTWDVVDDLFHRYATRMGDVWEARGHKRYTLAAMLEFSSLAAFFPAVLAISGGIDNPVAFDSMEGLMGGVFYPIGWVMSARHSLEMLRMKQEKFVSSTLAPQEYDYMMKPVFRVLRLPALSYGLVEIGKAAVQGNPGLFMWGVLFGALAGAMYIKDHDPFLLDSAPAWKQRLEELSPNVVPVTKFDSVHYS